MTEYCRKISRFFNFLKKFMQTLSKAKSVSFLDKLYEKLCYDFIIINKPAINVTKTKKNLDPFYSAKGLLIINCFNLFRANFNFFYINNKPKIFYTFHPKIAFF